MQTATVSQDRVWTREDVIDLIKRNKKACAKALHAMFLRQTADEQASSSTSKKNGVGFNAKDAYILSEIAKKLPRYDFRLTDRQHSLVAKLLTKYSRQLLEIIEEKGGKVQYPAKSPKPECAKSPNSEIAKAPDSDIVEEPDRYIAEDPDSDVAETPISAIAPSPVRDTANSLNPHFGMF